MGTQPWVSPPPGGGEAPPHPKKNFFLGEYILNGFLGVPDPKYEIKIFSGGGGGAPPPPKKKFFFWGPF